MAFGMFIWVLGIIAFLWVVADIIKYQKKMDSMHKILWIVAAFFFSIITAIVYYFVVKK
ncbi:PLDc N-terminal domain-containing protein [Candidatus Woesearchaeota archaeon]|nr:PLDc N-terminal domain-containing protein [Candidatus Woesearchaeota archaeon]